MTTSVPFTPTSDTELAIVRILDAPRAAVWRCWTEPHLLKQWYCPRPWTVPEADFDLRPGGRMNMVMAGPNGERNPLTGIFLEVSPQESLTFTDAFTEGFIPARTSFMTGYVRLSDEAGGGTRLVWGARHKTAEDTKTHLEMGFEQGWCAAAQQLEDLAKTL
jgi:uncharacterized protein YndB with AHSA1/START domain